MYQTNVVLNWPQIAKGEKSVSEARYGTYGGYFQTRRTVVNSCAEPTLILGYQNPDRE